MITSGMRPWIVQFIGCLDYTHLKTMAWSRNVGDKCTNLEMIPSRISAKIVCDFDEFGVSHLWQCVVVYNGARSILKISDDVARRGLRVL